MNGTGKDGNFRSAFRSSVCVIVAVSLCLVVFTSLVGFAKADGVTSSLTNGVGKQGTLTAAGKYDQYYITISSGYTSLTIQTYNPTGTNDFDLYVKKGDTYPTTSSYDYRAYTSSSSETITISNPAAATYRIRVQDYSGSGTYYVKATTAGGSGGSTTTLAVGSTLTGQSLASSGSKAYYQTVLGSGYSSLVIQTLNPTGTNDFDLYVKLGAQPTTSSYDVRAYTSSSSETCTISNPAAGTYYTMVYAYSGSGGFSIKATGTSAGDTTAPTISSIASSSISTSSATITWTTNEASTSVVEYGTTTSYGSTATGSSGVTSHSVTLSGLSASTTYHYRVKSADAASNLATSTDKTFTTQSAGDTTAPTISAVTASSITTTGATITWTTNEASSSVVEYGTTTSYGSTATGSNGVTSHSVTLGSLTSGTTYYYRVKSADAAGNLATSSGYSFATQSSGGGSTNLVVNGNTLSGSISTVNGKAYYTTVLDTTYTTFTVQTLNPTGTNDFDLYVKKGAQPTTSSYDVRGYTSSSSETCTISNAGAGTYYTMVYSYSGTGGFSIKATGTAQSSDTTAPTISSVSAGSLSSSGATVTWTTNEASTSVVEYGTTTSYGSTATGSSGVTSHSVTLSGLSASTTYHYRVKSADAASNTATSTDYTFTTSASSSGTTTLTLGVVSSGHSFTATGQQKNFQVTLPAGTYTSLTVVMDGPSSGADFDLYVKKGSAPTTSSYDAKGYTSSADETCTLSSPTAGTFYIMAYCYSGTGSFTMKADAQTGGGGGGDGTKFALCIGISNYQSINDLTYCDEDADDWAAYLQSKGYAVTKLIDSQASEAAIYSAIDNLVSQANAAGPGAYVAITFSGHGGYQSEGGYSSSAGTTYGGQTDGHPSLCYAYDADGYGDGCILDNVLAYHLSTLTSTHVMIFFDSCRSGGMDEVNQNGRYVSQTCAWNEYGYDGSSSQANGCWTYWFVDWGLKTQLYTSFETCHTNAYSKANAEHSDMHPEQYDGYSGSLMV